MRKRLTILALVAMTGALAAGAGGAAPAHAYCMEPGVAVDLGPVSGVDVPDVPGAPTVPQCLNMIPCSAYGEVAERAERFGIRMGPMYCLM